MNPVDSTWNLADMFPDDAAWEQQFAKTEAAVEELAAQKGHAASSAGELLKTAGLYETCLILFSQLAVYASCKYHPDLTQDSAKGMLGRAMTLYSQFGEKTAFLAPELVEKDMSLFDQFCVQEPKLELYRHYAEDFFARKAHVLDQQGEAILVRMGDVSSSFRMVYDDLTINDMARPEVTGPDGKQVQVSEAGYGAALQSPDREYRKAYFEGLLGAYGKQIHTLSSNYSGAVKADVHHARSRGYTTARECALAANHVPEAVYDNLIQTVRANTKPLQDYVSLRKRVLGISDFHFYDFFVPIVKGVARQYPYEEGKELALKATAILGEDYGKVMEKAVNDRWIDVYPGPNKMTGAYSTGAFGFHPYMLLNYDNTLDDVFTLVHELGHSMHTHYSETNQPFIYSEYSIFCAEVASTTNEMLLHHYLLERAESKEMKALLLSKHLDDLRSTFYRQTMFADFEYQTHKLAEEGVPLLPSTLCEIHRKLNEDYYGPEFAADETISYEWARIPHFYRDFYVYQYATGISAAIAISRRILEKGRPAVEDYKKFLSGGSSAHPIELLKLAGVDMAAPQPILDTTKDFAETLAELEKLL